MITGVAAETMPRDDGWRFLVLGCMLERAEMTCRLLSVRWVQRGSPDPQATYQHWGARAEVGLGLRGLRARRTRTSMGVAEVLEFLLLVARVPARRAVLPALGGGSARAPRRPATGRSRRTACSAACGPTLEYLDVPELVNDGLQRFLDQLQESIWQVADASSAHFFQRGAEHELHALGSI